MTETQTESDDGAGALKTIVGLAVYVLIYGLGAALLAMPVLHGFQTTMNWPWVAAGYASSLGCVAVAELFRRWAL